jgi:hypothetical protein
MASNPSAGLRAQQLQQANNVKDTKCLKSI